MKWSDMYVPWAEVRKIVGDLARRGVSFVTYPINSDTTLVRYREEGGDET